MTDLLHLGLLVSEILIKAQADCDFIRLLLMWLRDGVLVFCVSQLSGSGGGDRLCAGLQRLSARGGQVGGDQREGRSAGIVWHAWGWRQFPVKTQMKKTPFLGIFFFLSVLPKKGNMTKVECSTAETESFLYLHWALNVFCYIFWVFLSHLVPLKW